MSRRSSRRVCHGNMMHVGNKTQEGVNHRGTVPRSRIPTRRILAATVIVGAGLLVLLFPLREPFVQIIAIPLLDAWGDLRRWAAAQSQVAAWTVITGVASFLALFFVRPRWVRRPRSLRSNRHGLSLPSDREILLRAIRHGNRRVLYRVIVARQMTRLALRLIRQRERCGMEDAISKLDKGTWPAPDSVKAFLAERRSMTARGLRVPEQAYVKKLSETLDFLERYAEGDDS